MKAAFQNLSFSARILLISLAVLVCGGTALAAKRVIFFTAGTTPTVAEKADIAELNAMAAGQYTVRVVNGAKVTSRSLGTIDYMAGVVPSAYKKDGGTIDAFSYPTMDPDNPPAQPNLPSTQAMVYSGQVVALPGGGSLTVTVAGGAITAVTHVPKDGGT